MFWIRKSIRRRRTLGSLFVVLSIFFLLGTSYAKDEVPRNLLILHSYHPSLSWTYAVMKGMQEALIQGGEPVQTQVDYMDARRYSGTEYLQKMESLLLHKLGNKHFDLVMLSDNDALDFFLSQRKRIAPEAPIIFCGINNFTESTIAGQRKITGVAEEVSLQETIDTALKLHLGTKEILVIGRTDMSADRASREAFLSLLQSFRPSVKFTFWDDLSANELRKRLPLIQDGSLVFINGLTSDETGRQLLYDETTRLIRESAKVPLYSLWDVNLGHGIVGGKLVSGYLQGKVAGELAVRVLRGEDPDKIPVVRKDTANRFMFDYRELSRFALSGSNVPAGSEIIHSPPSFYRVHKAFIWGGGVSLLIFSGIIVFLGLNILARKRAEEALRDSEARYSAVAQQAKDGVMIIQDNILQFVNPALAHILGYTIGELENMPYINFVAPESRPMVCAGVNARLAGEDVPQVYEAKLLGRNGNTIDTELSSSVIQYRGRPAEVGIIRDITERKRAEVALRESEEKFRNLVETTSDWIWETDAKGDYSYASPRVRDLLGYKPHEVIGRKPFDFMPADEAERLAAEFARIIAERRPFFNLENVNLRKDGNRVILETSGVPRLDPRGNLMGYRGIDREITQRKRAEEALRESEEEAKRLAREDSIMAEIGKIISSTLHIEEVYERFVAEVGKLVPFDRISINVKEEDKVKVAYISGLEVPTRRAGEHFPLAGSLVSEVMRTRSSLVVNPESMNELVERFPGYLPTYQAGLGALIGVPLFSRDELIGVMYLSSTGHFSYTERDRRLAERVANQISGAIANALVFTKLKRAEEALRMT